MKMLKRPRPRNLRMGRKKTLTLERMGTRRTPETSSLEDAQACQYTVKTAETRIDNLKAETELAPKSFIKNLEIMFNNGMAAELLDWPMKNDATHTGKKETQELEERLGTGLYTVK